MRDWNRSNIDWDDMKNFMHRGQRAQRAVDKILKKDKPVRVGGLRTEVVLPDRKTKFTIANEAWKLKKRCRVLIVPTREAFFKFRRSVGLSAVVQAAEIVITDRGEVVKSVYSKVYRPKKS